MAEPVTLLQATPGRVKVLREMEEHPYSVSDTVDYPESPMQTVMPQTEEAVGGGGMDFSFSNSFFPSLATENGSTLLSCTGGRVYLGGLYVDVAAMTPVTLSLGLTYYLHLVTTYANRVLSSVFSVSIADKVSNETQEYTLIGSVTFSNQSKYVLHFERMPGKIEILNRWSYYDA